VLMGFSPSALTFVANVAADMGGDPPPTYSWTPGSPLCTGTTYYWRIVSRTNATPVDQSLSAVSAVGAFTTTGPDSGCSGLPLAAASVREADRSRPLP